MLVINLKNGDSVFRYIGTTASPVDPNQIQSIQADEHELTHILDNVKHIPRTTQRVQKWFGDDAKFIVAYLFSFIKIS